MKEHQKSSSSINI